LEEKLVDDKDVTPRIAGEEGPSEFAEEGFGWDAIMVFPVTPKEGAAPSMTREQIITELQSVGLQTSMYYSAQKDEVYCKIRAPLQKLKEKADKLDYKMLMKPDVLRQMCEAGFPEDNIAPIKIGESEEFSPLPAYKFIYGKYDTKENLQPLYECEEIPGEEGRIMAHPFSSVHRLKLIYIMMTQPRAMGGCGFQLSSLQDDGSILACYALHDDKARKVLKEKWLPGGWRNPGKQPLDSIRAYFGEKIALYFGFLGHYTSWLLWLSIVGVVVSINEAVQLTTDSLLTPFFGIFVAIWCVLMTENWKRKEATLGMEWGMSDFEQEESIRPGFRGEKIESPIDGKPTLYFPLVEQKKIINVSRSMVVFFIFLVIVAVAAIYAFKVWMEGLSSLTDYASIIASFINSVQIQIFNAIYQKLVIFLNNRENYKTQTAYEDALISKLFAFQFVNSYASFFYVAFVMDYAETDGCSYGSCMTSLFVSLTIVFCTNLATSQVLQVWLPRYQAKQRRKAELEGVPEGKELSPAELEYTLEEYDEMMGTLNDYSSLSVQMGYATLFVTAFPGAPLLAFISNYAEIGIDGTKLMFEHQRPFPTGVQDIGAWQAIFEMMGFAAVIINAGLVAFTMDISFFNDGEELSIEAKIWTFILAQYAIFAVMFGFRWAVEDIPVEVQIQLKRQEFITGKVIDRIEDDDDDAETRPTEYQPLVGAFDIAATDA